MAFENVFKAIFDTKGRADVYRMLYQTDCLNNVDLLSILHDLRQKHLAADQRIKAHIHIRLLCTAIPTTEEWQTVSGPEANKNGLKWI